MKIKSPSWISSIAALIGGAFLTLAFAPFGWSELTVPALLVLFFLYWRYSTMPAAVCGFYFGIGFFSTSAYWVFNSIYQYGHAPSWVSGIITLLFVGILALFLAIQGGLTAYLKQGLRSFSLLTFPATWVLMEWVRSWALTGFPWVLAGVSQTQGFLKPWIPMVGTYGVSYLIALTTGFIFLIIKEKNKFSKVISIVAVGLIWGLLPPFLSHTWTTPWGKSLRVSLVQGNIPQSIKWNPTQVHETLAEYYDLTQTQWNSDLIIWPEGAIPVFPEDIPAYLQRLQKQARVHGAVLIAGAPFYHPDTDEYFNGILMLSEPQATYTKRHLVPFGEFYPLKRWFGWFFAYLDIPMSDLTPGPAHPPLLTAKGIKIAPFICYEISYPQMVLDSIQNANILLTVTDDSWFGDSIAASQHLQMAQMRALETQRPLLFATNSGITAIISAVGELQTLPSNTTAVLKGTIQPMAGRTPLLYYGYWPVGLIVALSLLWVLIKREILK